MNKIEPIAWRGVNALIKLIVIALPLIAVAILTLSFLDEALLRRLTRISGNRSLVAWLANGYNAWFAAAICLVLLAFLIFLVRRQLVNDRRLWFGTGCPNCKERELIRIKRHTSDRFYGLIGVPAYRYACRNCSWRGLRIARREHTPEMDLELEEAMLRFAPDGLSYPEAHHPYEAEGYGAIAEETAFHTGSDNPDTAGERRRDIQLTKNQGNGEDTPPGFTHRFTIIGPLNHSAPVRRSRSKP